METNILRINTDASADLRPATLILVLMIYCASYIACIARECDCERDKTTICIEQTR